MKPHPGTPAVITSAHASRSEDINRRQVRYLLSMGIRTACFVLAVVSSGPLRWVFFVGAVVLPYIAVVVANTSTRRDTLTSARYFTDDSRTLEGPPPGPGSRP